MRLVGDFGGTKTHLAVFDATADRIFGVRRYESSAYASMDTLLQEFLSDSEIRPHNSFTEAVFAVAGVVENLVNGDQKVSFTNLSSQTTTAALRSLFPQAHIRFCNDLFAAARMCARYTQRLAASDPPPELVALYAPTPPKAQGALGVLGAGTGLGEAFVFLEEERVTIFPSEGGHCDFAPQDEIEIALLRFLQRRYGSHVSYERILSGPGLFALYQFFLEQSGPLQSQDHAALRQAILQDPIRAPMMISQHALQKNDPICQLTVDRFVRIYGAEAGNIALKMLPQSGIYLCGGIAPKILPMLQQGGFLEQFVAKGRLRKICESIPVYVVTDPLVTLWGAAYLEL